MQEYVQLSVLILMTLNNLALVTGGEIASTFGNPESLKFSALQADWRNYDWKRMDFEGAPNQTSLAKALHVVHAHH